MVFRVSVVTHPPLSREQLVELVRQHRGSELLFREVERLRALERVVRHAMTLPADDAPARAQARQDIVGILEGKLRTPHVFGRHVPPTKASERKSRQQFSAEQAPMNYRKRGEVVGR